MRWDTSLQSGGADGSGGGGGGDSASGDWPDGAGRCGAIRNRADVACNTDESTPPAQVSQVRSGEVANSKGVTEKIRPEIAPPSFLPRSTDFSVLRRRHSFFINMVTIVLPEGYAYTVLAHTVLPFLTSTFMGGRVMTARKLYDVPLPNLYGVPGVHKQADAFNRVQRINWLPNSSYSLSSEYESSTSFSHAYFVESLSLSQADIRICLRR